MIIPACRAGGLITCVLDRLLEAVTLSCDVIVVTMPDGGDDLRQIDDLARLVERGCAIAAASRYVRGGQLAGAPRVRGIVSKGACRSLQLLTKLGTTDATNSFKACSATFAKRAGIDSRTGFDFGIELAAKARRLRLPIAEIPTIGVDHLASVSGLAIVRTPTACRARLANPGQLPGMRCCD